MKKVVISESQLSRVFPRLKQSEVKEDLFLKKNESDKKIFIFSDKEEKSARTQETIRLGKTFKSLGFEWDGKLGHWWGPYSQLEAINDLIKKHNKIRGVIEDLEMIEAFIAETDIETSSKNLIMDKLDMYINDLANATDQAAMDAAIRNYLTFYSRFHNYSLTNSFLIYLQKKDAKRVAGYNTWRKNNRGVKKGATPIFIWFPMGNNNQIQDTGKIDFTDLDGLMQKAAAQVNMRFGLGKVYDISDTYALNDQGDVPETPKWYGENEPSEVADELVVRLKKFAESLNIKITKETSKGGEKGFSAGEHINLSSDVAGVAEASVLIHELAHELLHWKTKSPFYIDDAKLQTAEMRELQAESVSYATMKYFELPVTQHPTYLALWKANKEKIMANLNVIVKCSKYIIDGVEAMKED
jgi:hypothetical protein